MKITIIELGIIHLKDCIDLDKKSLKGLWTKSQWEKELTDPKRICIGAKDLETKKLFGLCSAWLIIDELHITSIAVDPMHQRKGLGKSLLSELIIRSNSLRTNQIHLEVKDTNEPAKALYKSYGFKVTGYRSNFYKDGSAALLFVKELTNKL
tara:strand:- start:145 stop:600 length:456 start_codon:yes stop_codon:yes gene_type:complete